MSMMMMEVVMRELTMMSDEMSLFRVQGRYLFVDFLMSCISYLLMTETWNMNIIGELSFT